MHRREFLIAAGSVGGLSLLPPAWAQAEADITWHDVRDWGIEGKGWTETEKYFDRLPSKAKGIVRDPVWSLSRHSAGMLVRFRTDATMILADHTVTSSNLAMPHMPATGVSGLDLYAENEQRQLRWVSVSKPTAQHMQGPLISGLDPGERDYTVYLPLYNGTESLRIGVPQGASFAPIAPRAEKPIVFYGTSITHGACASRPGMPHPAILGRRLNRPVINLGFSGNGRMEQEVANLLAELDPAVYVIDCLPNMNGPEVAERTEPLVHTLRKAHPDTPIVLVEDRTYPNAPWIQSRRERHAASRAAFQQAYANLQQQGVQKLFYIEGEDLLGLDREDTTDGSHPSDLGFFRQADAMEPVLRKSLRA
ncbi:MAG: SGNH/GDSL hydrolase family protein [Planctomycetaceae bacterium]|nr:SGNH/GDSL hydrolase family protein [Planctomycetaceae bacterium]